MREIYHIYSSGSVETLVRRGRKWKHRFKNNSFRNRTRFPIDTRSVVWELSALSRRELNQSKPVNDLDRLDGRQNLTDSAFNQLGQYTSSSGCRGYCYAELAVFRNMFTKNCYENRIIVRRDIVKRRFSIWRPSAILDLLWRHTYTPISSSPVMVVFVTVLRACDTGYW